MNVEPWAIEPIKPIDASERVYTPGNTDRKSEKTSFKDVLQERLNANATAPHFSKHALDRMEQRGIEMNPDQLSRISSAINQAKDKGSKDSVVVVDNLAMVVNVNNATVVTCLDARGAILTKIDSVVFV
jgi:flagellar operon protein